MGKALTFNEPLGRKRWPRRSGSLSATEYTCGRWCRYQPACMSNCGMDTKPAMSWLETMWFVPTTENDVVELHERNYRPPTPCLHPYLSRKYNILYNPWGVSGRKSNETWKISQTTTSYNSEHGCVCGCNNRRPLTTKRTFWGMYATSRHTILGV